VASALLWVGIPILVVINGLFVAAEFALVAVRKTRVEEMMQQGQKGAKALHTAIEHIDRSIAATQLGVTLASVGLGWLGEPAFAKLLQPWFEALPGAWSQVATHSAATAVAFVAITFMHIVFGELVPKNLALQAPDRMALWLVPPLVGFAQVTRPLTAIMSRTANLVLGLVGYKAVPAEEMVHSVDELALLIEDTEEAGILEPDQAEFVQNVFRMADKQVRECLVPREKMATLELNTPPEQILEAVRSGAHTRMPVYEGVLDNIVGIVNTKDLFHLFSLRGVVILQDAMYPPLFLKPTNNVAEALRLFRKAHRPMALVRDDNDKVLGLITLEDVLEEIVGDIEDEHDRPTPKLILRRGRTLPKPPIPATAPQSRTK
jgi:CBS domain containing-hemolysin-like protein